MAGSEFRIEVLVWLASACVIPVACGAEPESTERYAMVRLEPRPEMTSVTDQGQSIRSLPWTGPPPTSPSILQVALAMPGVGELPWIANRKSDKKAVEWLTGQIRIMSCQQADSKNTYVMIGIKGDDSRQQALLVNAVAHTYVERLKSDEQIYLTQRRDALKTKYERASEKAKERRGKFDREAAEADRKTIMARQQLLLDSLLQLRKEITATRSRLLQFEQPQTVDGDNVEIEILQTELKVMEEKFENDSKVVADLAAGSEIPERYEEDAENFRKALEQCEKELRAPSRIALIQRAPVSGANR